MISKPWPAWQMLRSRHVDRHRIRVPLAVRRPVRRQIAGLASRRAWAARGLLRPQLAPARRRLLTQRQRPRRRGESASAVPSADGTSPMLGYIVHRLLIMIPTLIAISIVIFTIIHLPPGDYFTTYIAELQSSGETADLAKIAFLEAEYGFDRPLWQQYLYWVGGLLHGDMGYSFPYDLPVNKVVGDRLLLTSIVSVTTIIFTYIVAFPIGVYSATHQYSFERPLR